jgi:Domain of unknown function (DUF4386)
MSERGRERSMLLAGTVGVILLVLSFSLPGQIHGNESASEVVGLLVDNRTAVLMGIGLQIASNILFFVFVVGLRRILRRGEKERASLSTPAFTAGAIGGALVIVSNTMLAGITATVAPQLQQSDPNLVWALVQVYKSVSYSQDLFLGLFVLATSLLLVRSASGPRWIGWFGFLPGILWVVAVFTVVDPEGMIGLAGLFGGLLVSLWLLLVSLFLLPQAGATQTQARVAAAVQG